MGAEVGRVPTERDDARSPALPRACVPSLRHPRVVGADTALAWIGADSRMYSIARSEHTARCPAVRWRNAACDKRGRIVAITDGGDAWLFASFASWDKWGKKEADAARDRHPRAACASAHALAETRAASATGCDRAPQERTPEAPSEAPRTAVRLSASCGPTPRFSSVAAGGAHFVLVADTTHCASSAPRKAPVLALGDNRFGQLGTSPSVSSSTDLHPVAFFSRAEGFPGSVAKVVCGNRHSIALTDDGDAYVWGALEGTATEPDPAPVDLGEDLLDVMVKDAACGSEHAVLLLADGSVWVVGSDIYGDAHPDCAPNPGCAPHRIDVRGASAVGAAQWTSYAVAHA
ncbi:hypothetical protein MSPP1_003152 [Malassezia sp. CBS 17886]|nr:hypothetical protein MSPP1_003152 [Malassezia sp. CBS 17886]